MAPSKFAKLFSQHIVVSGKIEKVELIPRYIAPQWLTPILCPLLVKLIFPSNVNLPLEFAEIAPP